MRWVIVYSRPCFRLLLAVVDGYMVYTPKNAPSTDARGSQYIAELCQSCALLNDWRVPVTVGLDSLYLFPPLRSWNAASGGEA